jgi:transposase InsO family protein
MDFTQMPVSQGYKYLLVMIDTFTGWIEGFPTRTEKAEEVVKKLLHEIIPRFGLPRSLQSDNGTTFTSKSPNESLKHWALLIISIVPECLSLQEK